MRVEIAGLNCQAESTSGRRARVRDRRRRWGSDEVAFVMVVNPVNKNGTTDLAEWFYLPDAAQFRVRTEVDVDSGEEHPFQYPAAVDGDFTGADTLEICVHGYELDGAGSSETKAVAVHDRIRRGVEERTRFGGPLDWTTMREPAYVSPGFGASHDLLFVDLWYVDIDRPAAGGYHPIGHPPAAVTFPDGVITPDGYADSQGININVTPSPPGTDSLTENRAYQSLNAISIYDFDVQYSA